MLFGKKKEQKSLNLPPLPPPKEFDNEPKEIPPVMNMASNLSPLPNIEPKPITPQPIEQQQIQIPSLPDLNNLPTINMPNNTNNLKQTEKIKPQLIKDQPIKREVVTENSSKKEDKEIYVKLTTHKEIISTLGILRNKIIQIENQIANLEMLKEKEVDDVKKWHDNVEDIKKRLAKINSYLE